MEDEINNNEIFSKKLSLYLIYAQALEIHKLYFEELGEKKLNKVMEKYFLIDKNWLDEYKYRNDYFQIIQDAEQNKKDDYKTFKSKINEKLKKNIKKTLKIEAPKLIQELLSDYGILIPKNFVIVKKEIFESYFLKLNLLYDVIIGEKNIFIFDKKTENSKFENIFVCSIQYNENNDDITDFNIVIDYILIFNKEYASEGKKNFFELIINGHGINNYFIRKRLDNKLYGEQNIFGELNQMYGFLFKIKNNKNFEEEKKIFEGFFNQYIKKVYPDDYKKITEVVIDSIKESDNKIDMLPSVNNSKCITIYGNLYYYMENKYKENNCEISEFENISQSY